MSTTEQRLAANRVNALQSTGPVTSSGKAICSSNATKHGLLCTKLFLDDEDPAEYEILLTDLERSLNPVGAVERALVERIAVTLWRQRRLVQAETASTLLFRVPKKVAGGVSSELGRGYGSEIKSDDLRPFDSDRVTWCKTALEEIDALEGLDLESLEKAAPLVFEQLKSDADCDGDDVGKFIAEHKGGLVGFVTELTHWCREQLREAEKRPQILAIAEQVRIKRLVLPEETLVLLSRYQTTLDNQLFKLLRALREAQEWRLKTLEAPTSSTSFTDPALAA